VDGNGGDFPRLGSARHPPTRELIPEKSEWISPAVPLMWDGLAV